MSPHVQRIEICGGVASGKTTLATLLRTSGISGIFENFHQNPFWKLFYENPSEYAFETEVTFLLQHYSQVKVESFGQGRFACDFSFLQDEAYADVNLAGGRLQAFQRVYEEVIKELAAPALLVHLECSAEEELRRIRRRARAEEGGVQMTYLDALNRTIKRMVANTKGTTAVLRIDSEANDFAHDKECQRRTTEAVLGALCV